MNMWHGEGQFVTERRKSSRCLQQFSEWIEVDDENSENSENINELSRRVLYALDVERASVVITQLSTLLENLVSANTEPLSGRLITVAAFWASISNPDRRRNESS